MKVALVEKGRVGAEQSSRNWGWCRQQNRDARELPLSTKSLDLWEQFAAETGEDTGFRRCGLLYLSNNEKELASWAKWGEFARTVNVKTHMLTAEQAAEHGRVTGKSWKGGVFSPTDGTADPSRAAPAVARAIIKLGARCTRAAPHVASRPRAAGCLPSSPRRAPFAPSSRCSPVAPGRPLSAVSTASGFPGIHSSNDTVGFQERPRDTGRAPHG